MVVGLAEDGAWPPMLWIGGAQGAGKSTLAWALSRAHDLPLHPVDMWAYDHAYPFGCECGRRRCRATWLATPDDYEIRAAVSPLVTHREDE